MLERSAKMDLNFTMGASESLLFTTEYLKTSKAHQATRTRTRYLGPPVFLGIVLYTGFAEGFSPFFAAFMLLVSVVWFIFYPKRYDSMVSKQAEKIINDESYANSFGEYSIRLGETGIDSKSPIGTAKYPWNSVVSANLSANHLIVLLRGSQGYAISCQQVGEETSKKACQYIQDRIGAEQSVPPKSDRAGG